MLEHKMTDFKVGNVFKIKFEDFNLILKIVTCTENYYSGIVLKSSCIYSKGEMINQIGKASILANCSKLSLKSKTEKILGDKNLI
jgi:hypothetical protein